MFNEVLKYGAYIVDVLTTYKQPVFIYIITESFMVALGLSLTP